MLGPMATMRSAGRVPKCPVIAFIAPPGNACGRAAPARVRRSHRTGAWIREQQRDTVGGLNSNDQVGVGGHDDVGGGGAHLFRIGRDHRSDGHGVVVHLLWPQDIARAHSKGRGQLIPPRRRLAIHRAKREVSGGE